MVFSHLCLDERITIQTQLHTACSFKQIAKTLHRDPSTISKEIRSHLLIKQTGSYGRPFNDCLHRFSCSVSHLCGDTCHRTCHFCRVCYSHCSLYQKSTCPLLQKPPYVCNGCATRSRCTLEKHLYNAAFAQKEYVAVLSESRSGIALPPADLQRIDAMLSPLIKRGQSLNHVYASHADALMVSEKSIYHYMDMGLFSAKSLDLPRKVRFRPRKSHHSSFKVEPACRKNRSFSDYCSFMRQHPDVPVVQLDSVEGRKGGKVLLTIHFVSSECMLAFLRDYNDAASVTYIFNSLYEDLGAAVFRRLFPVCLTDNGSEFSNPTAIELDNQHQQRTRIFYCDPSAPYQKGSAENNHALIRRVLPKGHPLDALTQEDINRVMSHVNAVKRLKLGNHSPYEVFTSWYGLPTAQRLHISPVKPDQVLLRPYLVK